MGTPNQFSLNVRDLLWLQAEEKAWAQKVAQYTRSAPYSQIEAAQYLEAVRAELAQRTEQMQTLSGRLTWAASGAFEMLGGSGGAGAQGLAASVSDTAAEAAGAAADTVKNALIVMGLVALAAAAYLLRRK